MCLTPTSPLDSIVMTRMGDSISSIKEAFRARKRAVFTRQETPYIDGVGSASYAYTAEDAPGGGGFLYRRW